MIDFPASPTDGQVFSAPNGVVYQYSTTYSSWLAQNAAPALGGTGDFCASGSGALPATLTTAQPATSVSGNSGLWYTSANGQYRPPAGRYYLYGTMVATNPSAASSIQMVIRRNGTVIANSLDTISAAGYSAYVSPFTVIDANGSDIFDWQINGFLAATTSNYFSIGAFPLTGMQGPMGPIGQTQTVSFETGAVATGTTILPTDDTIPQITEGTEFMACAITPKSATSKLIIEVCAFVCDSVANHTVGAALFQDATANALAAGCVISSTADSQINLAFRHVMTSGTTSATTFRVRIGPHAAGTITFNGAAAGRRYGGVMASSIVIREVAP